jgi:hypothetical protein
MMGENSNATIGLPKDKKGLLEKIEMEWALLNNLVSRIDIDRMEKPRFGGWSVKDILAHITAWERFMDLHYLQNQPAHEYFGVEADEFESLDEDAYNAILYERNRHLSLAEINAAFQECHQDIISRVENMSFEDMIAPRVGGKWSGGPLLVGIAANTYDHYQEHRLSIEAIADSEW